MWFGRKQMGRKKEISGFQPSSHSIGNSAFSPEVLSCSWTRPEHDFPGQCRNIGISQGHRLPHISVGYCSCNLSLGPELSGMKKWPGAADS